MLNRTQLINIAADLNDNYRIESDEYKLEIGFLYGTAEMIVALTLMPDESYSEVREQIAQQINDIIIDRYLGRTPS